MIAIHDLWQYGTSGKKVEELASFLKENVNNTYVDGLEELEKMKGSIRKKVKDLEEKYPKTQPLHFSVEYNEKTGDGSFFFKRPNASVSTLRLCLTVVRKYKEGGAL